VIAVLFLCHSPPYELLFITVGEPMTMCQDINFLIFFVLIIALFLLCVFELKQPACNKYNKLLACYIMFE
jgi:hypothetical protein